MNPHVFIRPDRTTTTTAPRPRPRLRRNLWLLLTVVAGLLGLSAAPSHAAGESWSVTGIDQVGCEDQTWTVPMTTTGVDGGNYHYRTVVTSGGLIYMNELYQSIAEEGADLAWGLYAVQSGGPTTGTWPIPTGQPFKAVFTLERPVGTVLSSWTMVTPSCDSPTLLYNGPTAADLDEDYLAVPADRCPALKASTANGCPVVERTLTTKAKYSPRRIVGKLTATAPALSAGQPVTIWKVRPGPDRAVAQRTTNSLGKFKARVGKGRHYATAPDLLAPAAGQVFADRSPVVRVR